MVDRHAGRRGPWRSRGQSGRGRTAAGDPRFPPAGRAAVAPDRGTPVRSLQRSDAVDGGAGRICHRHIVGLAVARRADRGAAVGGDRPSRAPRRPRPGHGAGDRRAAARCRAAPAIPAAATAAATRQRDRGGIFGQADAGDARGDRPTGRRGAKTSCDRIRSARARAAAGAAGVPAARAGPPRSAARIARGCRSLCAAGDVAARGPCGRCGAHRGRGSLAGSDTRSNVVIASEAKQSISPHKERHGLLRSLAPRNDAGVSTANSARCSRN